MSKEFYINTEVVNSYSEFLRQINRKQDIEIENISKATKKLTSCLEDNVTRDIELHIEKLRKMSKDLSIEIDRCSAKLKELSFNYDAYSKNIN